MLIAAIVLAVLFSVFAINGVRFIENDGSVHKGIDSARLLSKEKNQWKGDLTSDVLAQVVAENKKLKSEYTGQMGVPDDVYAQKEQPYLDIEDLINSIAGGEEKYSPYAISGLSDKEAKNLYELRNSNIQKVIEEEATTPEQKNFLNQIYEKQKTPFYYEPAEGWKAISLLGEEYSLIIVLLAGFLSAGLFADEFQYKADAIYFSTKLGRTKAVHSKIQAGLIVTTAVYWISLALFTVISLSIMGVSGARTPIQMVWCYGIYNITYGQYFMIILGCGYIASLLSASITMLISAKLHSAAVASCVPFILFCVSPFLGRALPFHTFFNLTPDQLLNVCNIVKNIAVFQMGRFVFRSIPFVMGFYLILVLVLLPVTYGIYHRHFIK